MGRASPRATTSPAANAARARPPTATCGCATSSPSAPGPPPAPATPTSSAQFWRLARRIGKKKAAVAVAHSILVICWHLLTNDCDYDDLGGDYFTRRNNPDRRRDHLIQQLHALGYRVTLRPVA